MKLTSHSKLFRYLALSIAILTIALLARGYISPEVGKYWWVLAATILFVLFLLSIPALIRVFFSAEFLKIEKLEVALIVLVIANITVQLLGGIWGAAYPLIIVVIVFVSIFLGLLQGLFFAALQSALEFFIFYTTSPSVDVLTPWAHAFVLLAFSVGVGAIFSLERKKFERLAAQYEKLRSDVEFFKETQARATYRVLSELDKIQQERPKRAVERVLSLDQALEAALEFCSKLFQTHLCALYLLDRKDPTRLELRSFLSASKLELKRSISSSQSPFAIVLRELVPLAVPSVPMHQLLPYYSRQPSVRSLMCAPIVCEEKPLGVLLVDSLIDAAFDKKQAEMLAILAVQVADTIVSHQTIEQLLSESEDFAAYYELSKKMSASLNLEDIFSILLDSTKNVVPFDAAALVILDEITKRLKIKAVRQIELGFEDLELSPRNSLVGWAMECKRTLYIPNASDIKRDEHAFILSEKIPIKGINSILIIPLFVKNEPVGALFFGSREVGAFDAYHQRLLETLANQAAVSISNAQLFSKLERLAIFDGLTGLYNHRYFQEQLSRELARAERTNSKVVLILLDIDHFKRINDTYGHPTGDVVLKHVASAIKNAVREVDFVARYGGEEFAIIMPEIDALSASQFAERLRSEIESSHAQTDFGPIQITVSLGVSAYPDFDKTRSALIDTADKALYHAKRLGRNRVVCAKDLPKGPIA